jgi:hypothetical protein
MYGMYEMAYFAIPAVWLAGLVISLRTRKSKLLSAGFGLLLFSSLAQLALEFPVLPFFGYATPITGATGIIGGALVVMGGLAIILRSARPSGEAFLPPEELFYTRSSRRR